MHELMYNKKNINLSQLPNWQKRGIGIYKTLVEIEGFNPKKQVKTSSFRHKIKVDCELPIFDNDFFKDKFNIN
jgi:tRNA(His) 5'-end guanylyltransferase